jgi:hypothetical protein
MQVRYQRGYLRLGQRKTGPDRWEFLWWDSEPSGVRVRRKDIMAQGQQTSDQPHSLIPSGRTSPTSPLPSKRNNPVIETLLK